MTPRDVNIAFRDFLTKFSVIPGQPNPPVYLGFSNVASQPSIREFIVFAQTTQVQKNMGTDFFEVDDTTEQGIWTAANLYWITYQVDCYGTVGEQRMENLRTLFNSGIGADFFRKKKGYYNPSGIGVIGVNDIKNATEKDGTPMYAERYISDFTISARLVAHVEQDWLDTLEIQLYKPINGGY